MKARVPEGEKRKISYRWTAENDNYAQQHVIDVGDAPGHEIRIYEIQRAWSNDPPAFNGVSVREERLCAISDYVDINGRSWGYSRYVLENGDEIFARFDGTSQTTANPGGSERHTFTSVVTITDGTGAFLAIRGIARYTAVFDPRTGSNEGRVEGEYWMVG